MILHLLYSARRNPATVALLALLFLAGWAKAQTTTIFNEDFEGSFPAGWTVGDDDPLDGSVTWGKVNTAFGGVAPYAGGGKGYCAGTKYGTGSSEPAPTYAANMIAYMERGIDLRKQSAATLSFWMRIPAIEKGYDSLIVRVDGTEVRKFDDPLTSWTLVTVDLSAYLGGLHTLRFEFRSDFSQHRTGVFLENIELKATPELEFEVFGTGERGALANRASTQLLLRDKPTFPVQQQFNNQLRNTKSVSIIQAGTVVIGGSGDTNSLHQNYFSGRAEIKEMEIQVETLIIRRPVTLPSTYLKIYARNLRFEEQGSISTTPQALTTAPASGQTGAAGLPGGDVDVFVGSYVDATGNSNSKFILTGGKGQQATQGAHGVKGTDAPYRASSVNVTNSTVGCDGTYTYPAPAGYQITQVENISAVGSGLKAGGPTWPTDGTNATAAGTPGEGGRGGLLKTNLSAITGTHTGGAAGAPGTPVANATSSRTDRCVGGAAGLPTKAMHLGYVLYVFFCAPEFSKIAEHTTSAGASYDVPTAQAGNAGSRTVSGGPSTWLQPEYLRKVLSDAKDDYLQNRISEATQSLRDYTGVMDTYRADPQWNTAPFAGSTTKLELAQIYDEMRILLQQIANGLDYFGNPAGWVPMLSYEALTTVYNDEIDRSLEIIYLADWVTTKQSTAAEATAVLATARTKLADEIKKAQEDYDKAKTALANMAAASAKINADTDQLLAELQVKDNDLRRKAEENTRPPDWEVGLRVGLKVAGTICKMVPVGQPGLGAAGDVATLGSNFDPDKPWDTISGGLDIASTALAQAASDAATAQADKISSSSLSPDQLKEVNATAARTSKLTNMANASSALSGGIKEVSGFLESTKAPAEKIDAELEKLRAADPGYGDLVDRIKAHTESRRDYADKLINNMLEVAKLSNVITRNLLAIDAMSANIGTNAQVINPKVTAYLKDMERQAWDRLLRYQYYMAKAYEYRLVKPYTGTLDLEAVYNRLHAIGSADGTMTESQRVSQRGLFTTALATTASSILAEYNSNASETGSTIFYPLKPSEIAKINRGEPLYLNLVDLGFTQPTEENLRIVNLGVKNTGPGNRGIQVANGGNYPVSAKLQLFVEHSGYSNLRLGGKVFQFRHYNQDTRSKIRWTEDYFPHDDTLTGKVPALATNSLLKSISPSLASADVELYSRPALWADLKVWITGIDGIPFGYGTSHPESLVPVTGVTLEVTYDLKSRATATNNIEISVSQSLTGRPVLNPKADPAFIISRADRNLRKNSTGHCLRIYNTSTDDVTVTAPLSYGVNRFVKWVNPLGTELSTSPSITRKPTADYQLVAIYENAGPVITVLPQNTGTLGTFYSSAFQATNGPITSYEVVGLPAGLTLTPGTSIISGIPRVAGVYNLTVSATNSYGRGPEQFLALTISGTDSFDDSFFLNSVGNGIGGTVIGTYAAGNSPAGKWYNYVPNIDGILTLETKTSGAPFDSLLEAYEGNSRTNLVSITSNNDIDPGTNKFSRVSFRVTAGTAYHILLLSFDGSTGVHVLSYNLTSDTNYSVVRNGSSLRITDNANNGDTLNISQPAAGQLRLTAAGRTFSVNFAPATTGDSGAFSLDGINRIFIISAGGDDVINLGNFANTLPLDLTINGGTGNDTVNFQGDLTFAAGASLDVDLLDDDASPGADTVNVQANAKLTTSGAGTITVKCSRNVEMQGGSKLETTDGNLTVLANRQPVSTAGNFTGISLSNAMLKCGNGILTVDGKGGNDGANGVQLGLFLNAGAKIMGTGTVNVTGTGGDSTNWINRGITLYDAGTLITSSNVLNVTGTGGANSSAYGIGIALLAGAEINGSQMYVTGIGRGAPGSASNQGIEIAGAGSAITGGDFAKSIKGVAGPGASSGIYLADQGAISGAGPTVQTDTLSIDATSSISTTGFVIFRTSEAKLIHLGGEDAPGILGLSDAKLDRVTASGFFVYLLDGQIQLTSTITRSAKTDIFLHAPGGLLASSPGTDLSLAGGRVLRFGAAPLLCPITDSTGYPRLTVEGTINLSQLSLDFPGLSLAGTTHAGSAGETFLIVDNDGADAIEAPFLNLPEGTVIPWPGSPLFEAKISYLGGDGNDATLTLQTVAAYAQWAALNISGGQNAAFEGDANGNGISNAVEYVFGTTPVVSPGSGIITAPQIIPPDVDVYLERRTSLTVENWTPIVTWVNGTGPVFAPGVSLLNDEVRDTNLNDQAFYRYRVSKR